MIWILAVVFIIGIVVGVILPALAIVFFKVWASFSGKRITCRQIFDLIGY